MQDGNLKTLVMLGVNNVLTLSLLSDNFRKDNNSPEFITEFFDGIESKVNLILDEQIQEQLSETKASNPEFTTKLYFDMLEQQVSKVKAEIKQELATLIRNYKDAVLMQLNLSKPVQDTEAQ